MEQKKEAEKVYDFSTVKNSKKEQSNKIQYMSLNFSLLP